MKMVDLDSQTRKRILPIQFHGVFTLKCLILASLMCYITCLSLDCITKQRSGYNHFKLNTIAYYRAIPLRSVSV